MRRPVPALLLLAAFLLVPAACNLVVGGDDLEFRDGAAAAGGATSSAATTTSIATTVSAAATTTASASAGGEAGGGAGPGVGGGGIGGFGEGGLCEQCVEVEAVALGGFTCALLAGGDVRCWGENESGQLGLGNTVDVGASPDTRPSVNVDLAGVDVAQVAVGDAHACALTSRGALYCWGEGDNGRLGLSGLEDVGDNEAVFTNSEVIASGVVEVAAGAEHTCARLETNGVSCWGKALHGRVGHDSAADQLTPPPALALDGPAFAIAAGRFHTCAVTREMIEDVETDGITCWGLDQDGQLGNGELPSMENASVAEPVYLPGVTRIKKLQAGGAHTCALQENNLLRCWGSDVANGHGVRVEDAASDDALVDFSSSDDTVFDFATGDQHTCAVLNTPLRPVFCWGVGADGRLGNLRPDDVGTAAAAVRVDIDSRRLVEAIAAGERHTCVRLQGGTVRCWGHGGDGRLGYGDASDVGGSDEEPLRGDVHLVE
jgi:alpha-tubulin suppressor-like RCC1 family protein